MPLDEILQRLHDNDPFLTELDLFGRCRDIVKMKALGEALSKNSSLISLNLSFNQISAAGVEGLVEILDKNGGLASLDLKNNEISNADVEILAKALVNNNTLLSLDLSYNKISDEGALALIKMLDKNCTLTSLYLWNWSTYQISNDVARWVQKLTVRNKQYLVKLQATAYEQLMMARALFYKAEKTKEGAIYLPFKIRTKILSYINKDVLTIEQQRLIANYAVGNIKSVADRLSFFKVTKCDRVMKKVNLIIEEHLERDNNLSYNNKSAKEEDKCVIC